MNNEWKMVPVELLERILGCISYGEADELKAILAANVPPAGDAEVLKTQYRVSAGPMTGWSFWNDGNGDKQSREYYQVQVRELVDRAHVTRLTADRDSECKLRKDLAVRVHELSDENKDLKGARDGLLADGRCMTAARNSLRLQVNDLLISERTLNEDANALQSELTKAREAIDLQRDRSYRDGVMAGFGMGINNNEESYKRVIDSLNREIHAAQQSAPAAKGGSDE